MEVSRLAGRVSEVSQNGPPFLTSGRRRSFIFLAKIAKICAAESTDLKSSETHNGFNFGQFWDS